MTTLADCHLREEFVALIQAVTTYVDLPITDVYTCTFPIHTNS